MSRVSISILRDKKTFLGLSIATSVFLVVWAGSMYMSSEQDKSMQASSSGVREEEEHCGCGSSCGCSLNAKNNPCQCGPSCGCRKGL